MVGHYLTPCGKVIDLTECCVCLCVSVGLGCWGYPYIHFMQCKQDYNHGTSNLESFMVARWTLGMGARGEQDPGTGSKMLKCWYMCLCLCVSMYCLCLVLVCTLTYMSNCFKQEVQHYL